jgi:hypothetical protein
MKALVAGIVAGMLAVAPACTSPPPRATLVAHWSARFMAHNGQTGEFPWLYVRKTAATSVFSREVPLRGIRTSLAPGTYALDLESGPRYFGLPHGPICVARATLEPGEVLTVVLDAGPEPCMVVHQPSQPPRPVTYPLRGGPGVVTTPLPGSIIDGEIQYADGTLWVMQREGRHGQRHRSLARIDPPSHTLLGSPIPIPVVAPLGFAVQGQSAWVITPRARAGGASWQGHRGSLIQVSLATGKTISAASIGSRPSGIALGEGSVWVTSDAGMLTRIDQNSGRITGSIDLSPGVGKVGVAYGSVWVFGQVLYRIDPSSLKVTGSLQVGPTQSFPAGQGDAIGNGYVWLLGTPQAPGGLLRVDPNSTPLRGTGLLHGWGGGEIAVGEGAVWLAAATSPVPEVSTTLLETGASWMRVDPGGGRVLLPMIGAPWLYGGTIGGGYLWIPAERRRHFRGIMQVPVSGTAS